MKLILTFLVMLLIPFIGKNPHYVLSQYEAALHYYQFLTTLNNEHASDWAQLFSMLSIFGVPTAPAFETVTRVIFGLLTLLLCVTINKTNECENKAKIILIYAAINTYLLLFEPITEANTYIVFAPIIGFFGYQLTFEERNLTSSITMGIITLLYLSEYYLKRLVIPGDYLGTWITPLLTCIVFMAILKRFFSAQRKKLFHFSDNLPC